MKDLGSRNDIVLVVFLARNDVTTTIYKIRDTMQSLDPKSSLNPYWVTDVPGFVGETHKQNAVLWSAIGIPMRNIHIVCHGNELWIRS